MNLCVNYNLWFCFVLFCLFKASAALLQTIILSLLRPFSPIPLLNISPPTSLNPLSSALSSMRGSQVVVVHVCVCVCVLSISAVLYLSLSAPEHCVCLLLWL